jgi:hypothetical protein
MITSGSKKKVAVYGALAMACAPVVASATVLFEENFDTGTAATQSARWDIYSQDESAGAHPPYDTSAVFNYNYAVNHWYTNLNGDIVQRLVPLSPRSPVGAPTTGLRVEVNNVSDPASPNTAVMSMYPKLAEYLGGALPTGDMKMTFDVWMNYNGGFEGGGGSTEHFTAGIKQAGGGIGGGTPRVVTNLPGLGMTVNGDRGNAFDYRFYSGNDRVGGTDALEQEGGYVAQDMGAGQPGPADGRNTYYTTAFPFVNPNDANDIWHETPGGIGKHWQTVEIKHEDGIVYYSIKPAGAAAPFLISARTDESVVTGHAMIGYADFNNGTAAKDDPDALDHTYGVFDNIVVETVSQARPKWNVNSNGTWSNAANWLNGSPNSNVATADFTDGISGSGKTITVDGNQTVRAMVFDNAQPYTLNAGAGREDHARLADHRHPRHDQGEERQSHDQRADRHQAHRLGRHRRRHLDDARRVGQCDRRQQVPQENRRWHAEPQRRQHLGRRYAHRGRHAQPQRRRRDPDHHHRPRHAFVRHDAEHQRQRLRRQPVSVSTMPPSPARPTSPWKIISSRPARL